jgi:O-antigen ligase
MDTPGRPLINLYINLLLVVLAFSIPLYRQWVTIVAALVIILWFFDGRFYGKVTALRKHRLTIAVLVFIGINLVSLLWSSHPADGFDYVGKYRYLLLVPVIATSLRESFRGWVLNALLAGTAVSLVFSFLVFSGMLEIGGAHSRNPSPTMSHLDYSMVLAVVGLLVLNRLVSVSMDRRQRLVMAGLLLVIIGGLVVNIGRSGQAAFLGALLVMLPFHAIASSRRRATVFLAGAILLIVGASYVMVPQFGRRVDLAGSDLGRALSDQVYETSIGKRVAGMAVGLDIVRRHPMLGTGVGDNMPEFRHLLDNDFRDLRDEIYWFPHFHNQYIQIATELGALGLLTLAFVLYGLIRGPYRTREDRGIALSIAAAYAVGFLGDPFLHKQLPLVLCAFLAGTASANGRSLWWNETAP